MRLPRVLTTLAAGLGLLLGAITSPPAHARADDGAAAPAQWRSYWVDAFNPGIYTPAQVTALVEDALDVNANVLIVQTARRYDCFCNNALYPRTDAAIAPEPYDPLAEVVRQGHAAGLQVHAWVNVNTMWNSSTPPRPRTTSSTSTAQTPPEPTAGSTRRPTARNWWVPTPM